MHRATFAAEIGSSCGIRAAIDAKPMAKWQHIPAARVDTCTDISGSSHELSVGVCIRKSKCGQQEGKLLDV